MSLPEKRRSDGIGRDYQRAFGGLNLNPSAGDGEIAGMTNMSSDLYPLLAPRARRYKLTELAKPNGLGGWDKLCWADGTGFYYDGVLKGAVADSEKRFYYLNSYILIWPDKLYYNTALDEFGALEASVGPVAAVFRDGSYAGQSAEKNTLYAAGADWTAYFRPGDAVTISGCAVLTGNNATLVVREIAGDELRFYENSFTNGSESAVTVARTVPDMDWLCANDNRLWGCKGDSIYCSKLGEPRVWLDYEGLATGCWAVDVGSAGDFTACFSYGGYPLFFKEDHIYRVYGTKPSDFESVHTATLGVEAGSDRSLAVAGEVLYYKSRAGFAAYSGGRPALIDAPLGATRRYNASAGSDGRKYYVSCERAGGCDLLVYDTEKRLWHREDDARALYWAQTGELCFLEQDGGVWLTGRVREHGGAAAEGSVASVCEFADCDGGGVFRKGLGRVYLRVELEEGASLSAALSFDSGRSWESAGSLAAPEKTVCVLNIVPRRCDHYRLRLEGRGGWKLWAIAREYYAGSELH